MIQRLLTAANGNPTMSTGSQGGFSPRVPFRTGGRSAASASTPRVQAVEQAERSLTVFPRLVTPLASNLNHARSDPDGAPPRQPEFARNERQGLRGSAPHGGLEPGRCVPCAWNHQGAGRQDPRSCAGWHLRGTASVPGGAVARPPYSPWLCSSSAGSCGPGG